MTMARDALTDKELQLKKTARRRLVGAVTLVILMLVILPFVLKDRVAELAQNDVKITVINQSQSEPMLQLPDEELAVEPPADTPPPPSSANQVLPSNSPVEKSVQDVARPLAEVVAASSDKSYVTVPSQAPAAAPQAKKAAEVKAEHVVTESKSVATRPVAEKKSSEKPVVVAEKPVPSPAAARFFVQLGVFSDPKNLETLRTKLKQAGFNAISEPVDATNTHLRLRSGIFHDRDTAQTELKKLQAAGFSGMVTGKP